MKLRCHACRRKYPVRGYGVIIPACPFCGASAGVTLILEPGHTLHGGGLQTSLPLLSF